MLQHTCAQTTTHIMLPITRPLEPVWPVDHDENEHDTDDNDHTEEGPHFVIQPIAFPLF